MQAHIHADTANPYVHTREQEQGHTHTVARASELEVWRSECLANDSSLYDHGKSISPSGSVTLESFLQLRGGQKRL